MPTLHVIDRPIDSLKPNAANARTHTLKQIGQIATSIQRFGFNNPILIDKADQIIAGHGRFAAAQVLGLSHVPTIRLEHPSEAQKRAYMIADNRLAELAGWDKDILAIELQNLLEADIDFEIVRRQNIWRNWQLRLAECRPRLEVDVRRRACGSASGDVRWSVA